jgi:thiol-disulfide isomerase/thioredoxin
MAEDKLNGVIVLKNGDFDSNMNLTKSNLKNKVIILYYADWCGHCKRLKPAYNQLIELSNNGKLDVSVAAVNADDNDGLLERMRGLGNKAEYDVRGFPSIVSYNNGKYYSTYSYDNTQEGREKFRTLPDIIEYANGIGTAPITYVNRE